MTDVKLILGGPGCGKTTRLIDLVRMELASGVPAKDICYTTFTRKAAQEARDRASKEFDLDPKEDLHGFSTIHSLAFRALGLSRNQVLGQEGYREVADLCGNLQLTVKGTRNADTGMWTGPKRGDQCIFTEQFSRTTGMPLDRVARANGLNPWLALHWSSVLKEWKSVNSFLDFTDMLELAVPAIRPYKVVFIDEAQDLSTLQWSLIEALCAGAERVYIGGDDDQAIYQWAGANVEAFLAIRGQREVLPKSHRLPLNVFQTTGRVLARIQNRYAKHWAPARDGGYSGRVNHYREGNFDKDNGSWYILSRNWLHLSEGREFLRKHGLPYTMHGESSLNTPEARAARAWTTLQNNKPVDVAQIKDMFHFVLPELLEGKHRKGATLDNRAYTMTELEEHGLKQVDADWMQALFIKPEEAGYLKNIRLRGYKLSEVPHITISTIHQVKGGEADNIWLNTDMTKSSWETLVKKDPDSEHRVMYVGVSRAKKSLHIRHNTGTYGYKVV